MNSKLKKKAQNGQNLKHQGEISADAFQPYDVLSVIENNGEVTLPVYHWSGSFVTKRRNHSIALIAGALIFASVLSRAKVFH